MIDQRKDTPTRPKRTNAEHTHLNNILPGLGGEKIGTVHCLETGRRWLRGGNAQEGGRANGRGGSCEDGPPIRSRRGESSGRALRSGRLKSKRRGGRRGSD